MTILRTPEYGTALRDLVRSARSEIAMASAFATAGGVEGLLRSVAPSVRRKELHVRWHSEDLLSGASDLAVYELAKEHGFAVFMQPSLHAKFILVDRRQAIVGSANLTARGLGSDFATNTEAGILTHPGSDGLNVLEGILEKSILVTEDLFDRLRAFVEREKLPLTRAAGFPVDIQRTLEDQFTGLWVRDLPFEFLPPAKDAMDSSWDIELARHFSDSKCVKWVRTLLRAPPYEIYFGELTSSLHDTLLEDPLPYRTEVKKLVVNLINWCVTLLPQEFGADNPYHSQRLYLRGKQNK